MRETMTVRLSIRRPEDGSLVRWFGSLFNVKLTGEATGGTLSLVEIIEPPGAASPVHVHNGEDETVDVLEGEHTVRCGDVESVAPYARVLGIDRSPGMRTLAAPARRSLAAMDAQRLDLPRVDVRGVQPDRGVTRKEA